MKSLKRTLCLVLALVMVLGLFGIASATNFTDDNTIQYKEAVDVMTGIGAINGMGDGTFNPKGTITRAQAAKLVTYAVIGKTAADGLAGVSSSFSDVTVAGGFGWAIPSIEYLVKAGVINGRGDGTFDPNGEISGAATLKMLLCALGYGKKSEYVGDSWEFQATLDANRVGLTKGRASTASVSAPATREEVALYCLNTIQASMVEYVSTLDVYINKDGGLTGGASATIMGTVYPTLKKTSGTDDFENNTLVWKLGNTEIYNGAVPAAITYTSAKKAADLKKELRGYTLHQNSTPAVDVKAYIDGVEQTDLDGSSAAVFATTDGSVAKGSDLVNFLAADAAEGVTGVKAQTANGSVVRIYTEAPDSKVITKVTVVTETLTKVVSVNALAGVVTLDGGLSISKDEQPALYAKVAGLAVDAPVLVTVDKSGTPAVKSVTMPTTVTGKVARVTATNIITLDNGQSYGKAKACAETINPNIGKDVTMLLDEYGYVVKWISTEDAAATVTYGFVLDAYSTLVNNRIVSMATVAFADGEVKDVPAVTDPSGTPTALEKGKYYKLTDTTATINVWTAVELDFTPADPVVAAGAPNAKAAAGKVVALRDYDVSDPDNPVGVFTSTDKQLTKSTNGNGTNFFDNFYDAGIKFIVISQDSTTGAYSATVSTGAQNATTAASAASAKSVAVIDKASKDDATPVVKAVFINKGAVSGATDPSKVLFIPDVTNPTRVSLMGADGKAHTFYNYTALVNGAPLAGGVTVANKSAALEASDAGFYTFAESKTVTGAYDIEKLKTGGAFSATNVKGIDKASESHAPYFKLTGAGAPATTGLVDLSSATIVDIREATAQAALPITATPAGLQKALVGADLTLGVLYDATKGNLASVVYICGATKTNDLSLSAPTFTGHTATWSVSTAKGGDSVTLTVTIGATAPTNGVKLELNNNAVVTKCSADGVTVGTGTVIVPAAKAAAKTVITFTITLGRTAPTATLSDKNS